MNARRWLLLPGWGFPAAVWVPVAEALRALEPGCEVEAVELPAVAAPWQAVDALAARCPAPLSIVGWSLGAMLALGWAARHPGQIERLVLVGATPRFVAAHDWPHGMAVDTFEAYAALDARRASARVAALAAHGDSAARAVLAELRAAQRAEDADADAETEAAASAERLDWLRRLDLRAAVPAVRQPVLVGHGAADALVPVGAARWLAAALPGATLAIDERAGHAPFATRAAAFAARVAAWAAVHARSVTA